MKTKVWVEGVLENTLQITRDLRVVEWVTLLKFLFGV